MGTRVKCPKCYLTDRYDTSEYFNIGTSFVPNFAVECHNCNTIITSKRENKQIKPQFLFHKKTQNDIKAEISLVLHQKKLPEIFLQHYLKEEFMFYGFSDIEGPFAKGPDYKVILNGNDKWLEVETDSLNYKKHGHHLSRNFDKVEILFYLYDYEYINNFNHILPQAHIKADANHFRDWFFEKIDKKILCPEYH